MDSPNKSMKCGSDSDYQNSDKLNRFYPVGIYKILYHMILPLGLAVYYGKTVAMGWFVAMEIKHGLRRTPIDDVRIETSIVDVPLPTIEGHSNHQPSGLINQGLSEDVWENTPKFDG